MMANAGKAPLSLGIISFLVLFLGLALKSVEYKYSNYFIFGSFLLGGIFWIWSIISLAATNNLKPYQKTFWLIIVIAVPLFGGLIYQIVQQRRNKIAA
jgi:hypothetical protein